MSGHNPSSPDWTCQGCASEWPCHTRRRQLLDEYGDARVALAVYLGGCLVAAEGDLTHLSADRLHDRFVGWTRATPAPLAARPS